MVSRRAGQETASAAAAVPAPPVAVSTAAALPAPAVLATVEKPPVATPVPTAGEPLVKRLAAEDKRIAQLEARLTEAEAAAKEAQAAKAAAVAAAPGDAASRLMAVRGRLEPGRKHTHRLSREDFQFALDEARAVLEKHPRNPDAAYLATYGRGGLAYVEGNDVLASSLLVEAFTELRQSARRDARPIGGLLLRSDGTLGPPNGWELAIGYGDARGEAMGLLDQELAANPRNQRALRARMQLRKMQGADDGPAGDVPRPWIKRRQRPN